MADPKQEDSVLQSLYAYLGEREFTQLDEKLDHFLDKISGWLSSQGVPPASIPEIFAYFALIFPLHLLRKGMDAEVATSGVASLAAAFSNKGHNLRSQIKTVIDEFRSNDDHVSILCRTRPPINLVGYDPRFSKGDDAKKYWRAALTDATKSGEDARSQQEPSGTRDKSANSDRAHKRQIDVAVGEITLKNSYNLAKSEIYSDFHNPLTRYDLLLIDFSWLPELAYQGHIVPLDQYAPGLRSDLRRKLNYLSSGEAEWWTNILSKLCRGPYDSHYAIPLICNLHGILSNMQQKSLLTEIKELEKSSVQNAHTACCVYELYAHFAHRKARPIVVQRETSSNEFVLQKVVFTKEAGGESTILALSDYLSRLWQAERQLDRLAKHNSETGLSSLIQKFELDHNHEYDLIEHGAFTQDVCFNSELMPKIEHLNKLRASPEFKFLPPCSEIGGGSLLSFGGYGLAVSRQAANKELATEVALALFNGGFTRDGIKAAHIIDEYCQLAAHNLLALPTEEVTSIYVRPQMPFWSAIEGIISFTVEDIYAQLKKHDSTKLSGLGNNFVEIRKTIWETLQNNDFQSMLRMLERKITLALKNSGWRVTGTPK